MQPSAQTQVPVLKIFFIHPEILSLHRRQLMTHHHMTFFSRQQGGGEEKDSASGAVSVSETQLATSSPVELLSVEVPSGSAGKVVEEQETKGESTRKIPPKHW